MAEAVLEFQFHEGSSWDSTYLGKIHDRLSDFPEIETIHTAAFVIQPQRVGVQSTQESKRFWRADRGMAVTVGEGLLAVSALPPQMNEEHSWELLRDTAFKALDAYRAICRPGPLRQGGVRYINLIRASPDTFCLGDYITATSGVVPESLLDERNPFSLRLERTPGVIKEYYRREVITLSAQPKTADLALIMLDVAEVAVWPTGGGDEISYEVFDQMHDAVHDVFNRLIRPDVLETFGPISS